MTTDLRMPKNAKGTAEDLRILYAADLHGNLKHYHRLLSLAVTEKADAIVLGGDLFPKGQLLRIALEAQESFIIDHMIPLFLAFKGVWPDTAIYLMMGNDDFAAHMSILEGMETEGLFKLLHLRVHRLTEGLSIAGYGCVPPTSFLIKDWERLDGARAGVPERSYQACNSEHGRVVPIDAREWFMSHNTISEDLETLANLSEPAGTVYVIHAPPFGTKLDVLGSGRHAGSRSVRRFIEDYTPPLTLHGHIHESHRITKELVDRVGNTICVNAGQAENHLHAVIIEIPGYVIRRV